MLPKSRFLRILLVLVFVVLFVGYFAFSTFLFSPTEDDYDADVSTLAPRDVDFFVAKARLRSDFAEFPELAISKTIRDTRAWRTFSRSPEYAELDQQNGIEAQLAQLRDLPKQLHGIDPLDVFGGKDVAVAGFFRGPNLADADWAVYGRVNWIGKLGVSLLRHPQLLGLESQGLSAVVESDHVQLSGGQLVRPVFVARVRDVVVAGTSLELVRKSLELEAHVGQDSFGQGATYADHIENARRSERRDELELYVDWRAYAENLQLTGRWPDAESQDFAPAFAARLFQIGSLKALAGVIGFDAGVNGDLHADLSSELMTPVQKSLYRTRGVERPWIQQQAARLSRADAAFFLCVQADLGLVLHQMYEAADVDTRSLLDDTIRSTGQFTGATPLIDELGALFKDRAVLIVRDNDYPPDATEDPPHDDEPVPAVALVLWSDGTEKARARIEEFHQMVVRNQQRLSLQGKNPGERGVFKKGLKGGFDAWEFWSPLIPGTGEVAAVVDGERYILSNTFRMLEDVVNTYHQGPPRFPRLSERAEFTYLVGKGMQQANVVAWTDPRALGKILRKVSERNSVQVVKNKIDWVSERAMEEDKVLREQFPGEVRGRLSPEIQVKVNDIVNPRLDAMLQRVVQEQAPAERARVERQIVYSELVSAALVMLALDPKSIDVSLGSIVPLEPQPTE